MNHASFAAVLAAGILSLCASSGVRAHDAHEQHATAAAPPPASAKVVLGGAPLVDQTGKRVRLAGDVIADRIAVVNFIYTTCTTVCPVSSATLSQLQQRLGSVLGKEVVLVSITVDPLRDTPQRLRDYAARYDSRAGWIWLTGAKPDVDSVLKGLGAYTPRFEDHPTMVLVGDTRNQTWTRFYGFPSADQLAAKVEAIAAARSGDGQVAHHAGH